MQAGLKKESMGYITDDFLLPTDEARELYHNHAAKMPVIDYHCHLNPQWIADDVRFGNIGEMWLGGDHYKWRAMRAYGVEEEFITGPASWREKFDRWAATVPYAMRNPLYVWTHLELKRIFGCDEVLSPATANRIWEECNAKIAGEGFSARGIMRMCNVESICTTDDPADTLCHHMRIAKECTDIRVLPTWRPDNVLKIDDPTAFNAYMERLAEAAGMEISSYVSLLEALQRRHDFFAACGCRLSDHGLSRFYATPATEAEVTRIFDKVRGGAAATADECDRFISAMLYELAVMDAEKGWVQQFHIGPIRNNASSMFRKLGADIGFDAIDDRNFAAEGFAFFDRLYSEGKLAKTILYNLNPRDNDMLAVMANTYNEAPVRGKMQYGSAWWFADNESGMRSQIDALSHAGLLGTFVGMLTDSRSILSYPRHEYFRRILCDMLGSDLHTGRLPRTETERIGQMVEDISYNNIKEYLSI